MVQRLASDLQRCSWMPEFVLWLCFLSGWDFGSVWTQANLMRDVVLCLRCRCPLACDFIVLISGLWYTPNLVCLKEALLSNIPELLAALCWSHRHSLGASDLICCIVDISIASAWTALGTIGVGSKNTLLADTSSTVSPVQPGLLQAQVRVTDLSVQSITTQWTHHSQVHVCCYQSFFRIWAQTRTVHRPLKYSSIQLPKRINQT